MKGGDDDDGDSSYSLRMLAMSMWRIRKPGKSKIYLLFLIETNPRS